MKSREKAWEQFVERYELDVPETMVDNELNAMVLEYKHRMQYEMMAGHGSFLNMQEDLEEQTDDMRRAAYFEVKSELVMKTLLAEHPFEVTTDELEAEAHAMAERQNTSMEMIKRFFGDDLSGLKRDIKARKAKDWVLEQAG